jgi:hypothetical protein
MTNPAAPRNPLTKTELLADMAAATKLPKTQVAAVPDALGAGAVTISGFVQDEQSHLNQEPSCPHLVP